MLRFALLILLLLGPADDGSPDGRRGNELYRKGRFPEAAEAYRQGIVRHSGQPGAVLSGLYNNLGSALYRAQDFAQAGAAFADAFRTAATGAGRARAAYNAGNSAVQAGNLQEALGLYREALRADPDDVNARYNYEFVRRKLQDQQQRQQQNRQDQQQQQQNRQGDGGGQGGEGRDQQQQQQQEPRRQEGQNPEPSDESQQEGGDRTPGDEGQDPRQLSREEAERILQALQTDEKDLLKQLQRRPTRPRRVEKDW